MAIGLLTWLALTVGPYGVARAANGEPATLPSAGDPSAALGGNPAAAAPLRPGDPGRFADDFAGFAAAPVPPGAVLLVGSSSIRMWPDPAGDLAPWSAAARGFGGGHLSDAWTQRTALFPATAPAALILYLGENDLAAGRAPGDLTAEMATLLDDLAARWGPVPTLLLGPKPSPARQHHADAFAAADAGFAALADELPWVDFLSTAPLLSQAGAPLAHLYLPDRLHLSPAGYARWTAALRGWLAARSQRPAPLRSP